MDVLRKLLKRLGIDEEYLVITDRITGAGYIADNNDNVFCRWSRIQDGISILEAYIEARNFDAETQYIQRIEC